MEFRVPDTLDVRVTSAAGNPLFNADLIRLHELLGQSQEGMEENLRDSRATWTTLYRDLLADEYGFDSDLLLPRDAYLLAMRVNAEMRNLLGN